MLAWLAEAAYSCWDILVDMAPYVLLGFAVAGALFAWLPTSLVERHLGGERRLWPVFKAALVGIPLPLCCCGVIPLAASLRRQGAGRGPTTAFLISTPQTGADSILVTYSLLGPVYAVLRPVAALVSGLVGGLVVGLGRRGQEPGPPPPAPGASPLDQTPAACGCQGSCAQPEEPRSKLRQAWDYAVRELPEDLARPFLFGVAAAGTLAALLPQGFFAGHLGAGWPAMLLMLVVGAPLYICATAAVPLAAAFLAKGLSPGAVLVFLMAAPATNLATIATVWKVLGLRTLAGYLLAVFGTALAAGWLTDLAFAGLALETAGVWAEAEAGPWQEAAAVLLLLLLAGGLWSSWRSPDQPCHAPPPEGPGPEQS
jgi:hypothetical protein